MNDFVKIKQKLDLNLVIPALSGFRLDKNHLEECPFCGGHDCFSISPDGDFYKCFQCENSGDIYNFLTSSESLSSYEALLRAAELAGIKLRKRNTDNYNSNDKLLLSAAHYYNQQITKTKNAKAEEYFRQRGHSPEILKSMLVGWTDGKLHLYLRDKKYTEKQMIASGLVRKDKIKKHLYDFFAPDLAVFPHFIRGKVVHITSKNSAPGKKPYQLPKSKRHPKWFFYNQDGLNCDDLILVEGENDTLSVLDAGVKRVIGMIGNISDEQIKVLKKYVEKNQLYLWMDNDFDKFNLNVKGYGYVRKIIDKISDKNIRIFVYPQKFEDPDIFIQKHDIKSRHKSICNLQKNAVDYLTWEIMYAGELENLEEKLNHLRKYSVFQKISRLKKIEQQVFVEKLIDIGFTRHSVTEQIVRNNALNENIAQYFKDLENKWLADPNIIADMIHDYFQTTGRFYRDDENKIYLLYHDQIYEVGNNRPFNAVMKDKTGLLPTNQLGRAVWESLASEGYLRGEKIKICTWLHTDHSKDTIYVNLNSKNNKIIKIDPTGIDVISNATNEDNVFLRKSAKLKPFNYIGDADITTSISMLKELIYDNLSCEYHQRYLLICWFISTFLSDFSPHVSPLLKAEGETASGKTTAARMLEYLLYGDEHLGEISVAGAYADASQSPLLVIDNLENRDLKKNMLKFLLLVATRGSKVKRKGGTESDVTQEKPKSMVMITAIEPFDHSELINRTFTLHFSKQHHNPTFVDDEITRKIMQKRDYILSGIFKLIQHDILPNLDRRSNHIKKLNRQNKAHSKERLNTYIALMMLVLEQMLKYWIDPSPKATEISKYWIDNQHNLAQEQEVSGNNIIRLLDGLIREYRLRMSEQDLTPTHVYGYDNKVYIYKDPEYGLTVIMTPPSPTEDPEIEECIVEFSCTSRDLCYAFGRFCKNNNLTNPYPSASIFGSRLKNDKNLLKQGGWELISGKEGRIYHKIIRGQRFLKFRHTLIR